jgi:hypothetical protein
MSQGEFAQNASYREYERLLIFLNRTMAEGKSETDEAEAIRDQMEGPWRKLTLAERKRLDGLSADLYQLTGEEVFVAVADPVLLDLVRHEFDTAVSDQEWQRALEMIRRRPRTAPNGVVAALRAFCYSRLGHEDAAKEFLTVEGANSALREMMSGGLRSAYAIWRCGSKLGEAVPA